MTTTTHLATSVEASRLRYVQKQENFFENSSRQEWRALQISNALANWAPAMSIHYLGSDKFIATTTDGGTFEKAFHLKEDQAFHHFETLTQHVIYVRCVPPPERREDAERFVLEQIALAFLPF